MATITRRKYVTLQDAGEYAAVNPRTVRRWIASGVLKQYRHGKIIRVDLNDVDELLARGGGAA